MNPTNYGETFKQLRQEKKKTLADVCANHFSQSFISKFERGLNDISLNNFTLLLNTTGIDVIDFFSLSETDDYSHVERKIQKLGMLYTNKDINSLEKNKKIWLEKYNCSLKKEDLLWAVLTEAFICSLNNTQLDEQSIEVITDHFFDVVIFDKFNIMLLGNTIGFMPIPIANLILNELINSSHFLQKDENLDSKVGIIINFIYLLLENDPIQAEQYFQYLDNLELPETYIYERIEISFAKAIQLKKVGQIEESLTSIEQLLGTLKFLGCHNLYESRKNIFDEY